MGCAGVTLPNNTVRTRLYTTAGNGGVIWGYLRGSWELLSNLVFEFFWSCGDLAWFCGFNSVFEFDANDDFGEGVKAA